MKRLILITGGARSGKSAYAERLALSLSPRPLYVATARALDEDMRERVRLHRERRGATWDTVEEPLRLSRVDARGRVALVDCLTMWVMNHMPEGELPEAVSLMQRLRAELDSFTAQEAVFIFVTNEVGLGGVSANALQRRFTDVAGLLNQYVASKADEVTLMVSGLPLTLKP